MGIQSIDPELCSGCEVCVDECPCDVLRMDELKQLAVVVYPTDCMVCLQCVDHCPTGAVVFTPDYPKKLWHIE